MTKDPDNCMIEFTKVSKRYGAFAALDDFSLTVHAGEAVALWGPNGAGKTTAMKCLLGLLRYQGRIVVDGLDARRQGRAARRRLGYVPQQISLYPEMRTRETAHFFARLNGASGSETDEVLERVGLSEHASKPVGALSGGMKQRLALGIALLGDPPVLVLDEPTTNLDAEARENFLRLLSSVRQSGKTALLTSHRVEEIERLADRVLIMDKGRVLRSTSGAELAEQAGLQSTVRLRIPQKQVMDALRVLSVEGFDARRNGVGVLVTVRPNQKALPIQTLSHAKIEVIDFDME